MAGQFATAAAAHQVGLYHINLLIILFSTLVNPVPRFTIDPPPFDVLLRHFMLRND
jgi:hypothetical protein